MAASAHLCLRWNNYQTNLTSVFDQLLQSETFVDVTLAADGHAIKAHRMVLSACSPYFQALFFDNPCQHPIVILKDTRWSELKAIVEYMYRGEISVAQEELTSLLRVAETLKIRGLSELNSDRQGAPGGDERSDSVSPSTAVSATPNGILSRRMASPSSSWPLQTQSWSRDDTPTLSPRTVKRRRTSGTERSSASSPAGSVAPAQDDMSLEGPLPLVGHAHQNPASSSNAAANAAAMNLPSLTIQQQQQQHHMQPSPADELDIKPGIAELIREEERARMLEGSHPWLATPPSVLSGCGQAPADPRDALWQKAWATGQGVVQNLRFRERGPFKTWRPETMAEAIMAVLREGLSLSQAARKFDIPYPTFVLYANRVNNMLGPSVESGIELRPKGRGRPQRILTGSWPEDHVHGVIRAVVFRDPSSLPRHFERGMEREDLSRMTASKPSISRIITTGPNDCGGNSITGTRLNPPSSNAGGMGGMSSSSSNLNFPPFNAMRSMAGPSSASNGIEIIGANNLMNPNSMNNNAQLQSGSSSSSCLVNSGGGLTSSSLFSVLQQEVAEETRLAALNAMNQRLMPPMDNEPVVSMTIGGSTSSSNGSSLSQQQQQQLSCQQQQQQQMGWFPGANFTNQIPMVDDVGAPDDVEQLSSAYPGHSSSAGAVHVKQEQLFGD